MVHLVLGHGEVGRAIVEVLEDDPKNNVYWKSRNGGNYKGQIVDVLHVCIPYKDVSFMTTVDLYRHQLGDPLIIVHSSVPVGTCDELGVVHSPIRGVHPHLAKGIRTFVKYVGGKNKSDVRRSARIFRNVGITVRTRDDARTTEALKLWSTTQYGRLIMLEKEIYKWCKENDIDFDFIYKTANKDYNEGYIKLGRRDVVRPYLKHMEGPIGGHCVLPNVLLLGVKL